MAWYHTPSATSPDMALPRGIDVDLHLDRLHYVNGIGTDITVGLNEKGLWGGGGATTQGGTFFFPNMPTEEVFTSPDFRRVDGTVHSSMPLNHDGSLIDDF